MLSATKREIAMDITSGKFRLNLDCNNCFLILTLYRTDAIVGKERQPDWILSVLQLSTPLFLSNVNGMIKNWLNAFGFVEVEKLDEALNTFFKLPVPAISLIRKNN
jgi:hypothetical protein